MELIDIFWFIHDFGGTSTVKPVRSSIPHGFMERNKSIPPKSWMNPFFYHKKCRLVCPVTSINSISK